MTLLLSVKLLKEELTRMLSYKYFSCLPPPPNKSPEVLLSSAHSSKNNAYNYCETNYLWVFMVPEMTIGY